MCSLIKRIIVIGLLIQSLALSADIEQSNLIFNSALSPFRVRMLGYSDSMLYKSTVVGGQNDLFRHWSLTNTGIAFYPPINGEKVSVDSSDLKYIEYYSSTYLNDSYYDPDIFKFLKSFWLKDFERNEFYFDIISNGVPIRFSGWYGHCIHIIIFTDFNTKSGFLEKINDFFNLADLHIQNVYYKTDADFPDDFFLEYKSSDKRIKVYGYPLLLPNESNMIAKISGPDNTALEFYFNNDEDKDEE